ncbi:hypothetical protein GUA87_15770 [Sneathiella sp. P13V-1]|uniref:DUF6065 family protein n=1 Tax=Sneathiella sp. P13V-1 TaxID=2697366 RepID=UPI00187B3BF8|nr:DUF6065 family protein [Sneathiella sp. P13V-1]MBE7638316.1 hypothetical protein [Sneathiella sp. P13V-1]
MSVIDKAKDEKLGHLVAPTSIIRFYRMIPDTPTPQRADRSAGGLIPTRAFRYCEPMTTASAFGWYIFPPMDFSVYWDGNDMYWRYADMDSWFPLEASQYPDYAPTFNDIAPQDIKGYSPPFISSAPEPGVLKIWSGLIAKTAKDWSILVRRPANLPGSQLYEHYEGIVETDHWFGPLFTNLRITKTDSPITIKREMPLMQVQPLHRSTYDEKILKDFEFIDGAENFDDEDWLNYHQTVIAPGDAHKRERGLYAKASRKNRKRHP